MSIYILRVIARQTACQITVPRTWRNEHLPNGDKFVYAVENLDGDLVIMPERRYYAKRFGKAGNVGNIGAREIREGEDRPAKHRGAGGKFEKAGPATADSCAPGGHPIQNRSRTSAFFGRVQSWLV